MKDVISALADKRMLVRVMWLAIALFLAGISCGRTQDVDKGLRWNPCGGPLDMLDCATLVVPRRHFDGDARTVELAVTRSIASDAAIHEGTLFVHAGGPGIPHLGVLAQIRRILGREFDSWDVVALDTRGTPGSHDFDCGLEVQQAITGKLECATDVEFDASWSTADSVADLESLRKTIGDGRARFLGWSYGATLGALWMETYPESLERAVLDSPGSPWLPWSDQMRARFEAMDFLTPKVLDGKALASNPEIGVALEMALYDPAMWADFRLANGGDESRRKGLVNQRLGIPMGSDTGGISAQVAVRCSDLSPYELKRVLALKTTRAHGIGVAVESACATLELAQPIGLPEKISAERAPVLVIGAERDIASPISVVNSVADRLGGLILVVEGSRHTSVGFDLPATERALSFLVE